MNKMVKLALLVAAPLLAATTLAVTAANSTAMHPNQDLMDLRNRILPVRVDKLSVFLEHQCLHDEVRDQPSPPGLLARQAKLAAKP